VGLIYNKVISSVGNKVNPTFMLVGEAPGKDEVDRGQPFIGRCGQLLRKYLLKYNLKKSNTIITNTIPCRPPNNVFPQDSSLVKNCMNKWLIIEINILKPKYILMLGSVASKYVLDINLPITKIRGIIYNRFGAVCIPTFHPSYVMRNINVPSSNIEQIFEEDIRKFSELDKKQDSGIIPF
jgi:DNA polymerase